ncbi:hypothetical protein F5887DRAFT_1194907 [Amanita rubescens]|nr:hypothetical protein F5887DRAFT_1194907 [Amanita rubescens]
MTNVDLCFSPRSLAESGSVKLLELPPDLCSLVESSLQSSTSPRLSIKGQSNEDAVLCTRDKTYTIRSVVLSNTILVATPLGRAYDENQATMDIDSQASGTGLTYDRAKREIQASDDELECALKDRRILIIHGELRPIAPGYLHQVLELLLNVLIALSLPHDAAPVDELVSTLANDHEVAHDVTKQVLSWFGEVDAGKWNMEVKSVVKEIGLNLLRSHRHDPIEKNTLIEKWKYSVGDSFESTVSLDFLSGNFIASNQQGSTVLTYFPASELPPEPAARFTDLFLARPRWTEEDISPFLADIAVNVKERDKLLLKYCRTVTDSGSILYTARTQYSG